MFGYYKKNGKVPSSKWRIVKLVDSKSTLSFCKLCLTEKPFILNTLGMTYASTIRHNLL